MSDLAAALATYETADFIPAQVRGVVIAAARERLRLSRIGGEWPIQLIDVVRDAAGIFPNEARAVLDAVEKWMEGDEVSDETLYIYDRNTDYKLPPFGRYQKVTRPDALALFSDSELIGELVKRGVLVQGGYLATEDGVELYEWRTEWLSGFYARGEPVGSVGETP